MWQEKLLAAAAMMKAKERASFPMPMKERKRTRHSHSTVSVCREGGSRDRPTESGRGGACSDPSQGFPIPNSQELIPGCPRQAHPYLLMDEGEGGWCHAELSGCPLLLAARRQGRLQGVVDDFHAWRSKGRNGLLTRAGEGPKLVMKPSPGGKGSKARPRGPQQQLSQDDGSGFWDPLGVREKQSISTQAGLGPLRARPPIWGMGRKEGAHRGSAAEPTLLTA